MRINKKLLTVIVMAGLLGPVVSYADNKKTLTDNMKDVSKEMVETVADAAITTKVKALLAAEPDVHSLNIKVITEDHVVQLSGNTRNTSQAHRIIEIAQGVKGVKDVDDTNLSIEDNRTYLEDARTTALVKGKILQLYGDGKIAKGYRISVDTVNGSVHVQGKVAKRGDIAHIKEAVRTVKNVKNVHTNLEIAKG